MPTIPRCIEVVRDTDGLAHITIDSEPFPYALAAEDIVVPLARGKVPAVRLTLIAHTVLVSDEFLANEDLNEAHDHEAAQS